MSFSVKPLDMVTWPDFAALVERHNGVWGGCWCMAFHAKGVGAAGNRDDPARDAARVRAMYTHLGFVRRGVGRLILSVCEKAARQEGFRRVELGATMAGEPLYRACGYQPRKRIFDDTGGAPVPILMMWKTI
ncbi:GNAT family N-acetyltransferase [Mesorhizobium dulcispinae]|uniref:GNAT family N-acetyltransferase n=1 Tax=Mesorhizobium dulcispinae TaxID=3072316 RepID=UPI002A23E128|nr:GNAT family N-acetyltransferase [Mesorhizobium sp. VK23D]MDX8520779.1 GNAT family N-acetyltransferase [Mesorhizobium sp. VK23D]